MIKNETDKNHVTDDYYSYHQQNCSNYAEKYR